MDPSFHLRALTDALPITVDKPILRKALNKARHLLSGLEDDL
jgi:hypothetical protein